MPQTVLALSFQYALLLHVSRFYTAPLPSAQVSVTPGPHTLCSLCQILQRGCGEAGSSVAGSYAVLLHLVGKRVLPLVFSANKGKTKKQVIKAYFQDVGLINS